MGGNITRFLNFPSVLSLGISGVIARYPSQVVAPHSPAPCSRLSVCLPNRKAKSYSVPTIVKLACFLFSFSFTCIALGIYCPTTTRLLRGRTDSSRQIETLASFQSVEESADERATAPRNDWAITNRWRFYVLHIRFGVALNLADGANAVRGVMNTTLVFSTRDCYRGARVSVTVSLFFILGGCLESDL